MRDNHFYITTTLPYVNAAPHIGFAMEIIRADAVARFKRAHGFEVFFNTGTDEHGIKIYQKASEEGKDVQAYVDEYAAKFKDLQTALGLSEDINFIRTTDKDHVAAAQAFWLQCKENGYIEKRLYQTKYCVGCELAKTDSELNDAGRCPIHPNQDLQLIDEENYFFKFSMFHDKLLALYNATPDFVVPDFRFNEIRSFVERGLEDFSISRLKEKMPWGVPVPDDDAHVMYVWFDALVNYISAIGWPKDMERFETWWPVVQYCGKDNLRQQSAMWQAMLLACGLPPSRQIVVDGFINVDGQKMSKSLGNVVDPMALVAEYGTDVVRYYLIRESHPFEDSDYTSAKFKEAYNANLAHGLGNLISRVLKMSETYFAGTVVKNDVHVVPILHSMKTAVGAGAIEGPTLEYFITQTILPAYEKYFETFELNRAADAVWDLIRELDHYVTHYEPYKLVKTDKEKAQAVIFNLLHGLHTVGKLLEPIMPDTAQTIGKLIVLNKKGESESFTTCALQNPLFLKKE